MRNWISYIFIALVLNIYAYGQTDSNEVRTRYFPKKVVKVDRSFKRENLWVIIMAGQSNMAGRGFVEPQDTIPSDRVFTLNKNGEMIMAKEPLHFYEPSMTGLDCGLSFGKELVRNLPDSISILIIPTAVGGTMISQWLNDSSFRNVQLFTNFMEKVNFGKRYGTIKGVLWHQGENDTGTQENINLYGKRLSKLVAQFRDSVGDEELLVLIGELSSFAVNDLYKERRREINNQIRAYVLTDRNSSAIQTSDLKDIGDKVHFNSEGQRIMGQRFAKEYVRSYCNCL